METEKKPTDARYKKEMRRINKLLRDSGLKEDKVQILQPVIENAAWMKVKLDDARAAIKTSQIVVTYDNGGGQKGLRENPLYKGYEALWKAYMQGMSKIIDSIPDEYEEVKKEEEKRTTNVLELVRKKHEA